MCSSELRPGSFEREALAQDVSRASGFSAHLLSFRSGTFTRLPSGSQKFFGASVRRGSLASARRLKTHQTWNRFFAPDPREGTQPVHLFH
jgi:hypothetical protein